MSDITITIKASGDKKYEITFDPSITVSQLKEKVAESADIPASSQRLIYSGKVLKDQELVSSYKVQNGHSIHLVKSATHTDKPKDQNSQSQSQSQTQAQPQSVPSNISAGQGSFNPLADLTGARYAGYSQLPSASMFGPDGGMNSNLPDPEQLTSMMSNPLFQEQMNAMLSNPQMLDFMIQQNPQLRALGPQARQMLQSPFFRQMLTNPEMMRSAMEMGRQQQGGAAGASFPAPGTNPTVDEGDNSNPPPNPFANLFGGMTPQPEGSEVPPNPFANLFGGMPQPTQQDTRPPEERYESQLRQLNDMGFFDFDRNVEALRRTGGSVQGAIEYLLNN